MFVLLVRVGVDLGAGDVTVTEQFLNGPHTRDPHEFARKSMAEHVRIHRPAERSDRGGVDNFINLPS
ncbi:hypothetical protein ES703_106854 [subsurface metagenome]